MHSKSIALISSKFPDSGVSYLPGRLKSRVTNLTWIVCSQLDYNFKLACLSTLSVTHEVAQNTVVWDAASVFSTSVRLTLDLAIHLGWFACHTDTYFAAHRPSLFNHKASQNEY